MALKRTIYQCKVDVDIAVKSVLADVSSVSPSSEQRALLRYVTLRVKVKLYCVVLYYIILCYVMLCYVQFICVTLIS